MKKILCLIIMIFSVFLIMSALADDTDKFLGKWVCYNVIVDGKTYTMSSIEAELDMAVLTDGTAAVHTSFNHYGNNFTGVWAAEGNDMIVTDGESYMLFTMNASGVDYTNLDIFSDIKGNDSFDEEGCSAETYVQNLIKVYEDR